MSARVLCCHATVIIIDLVAMHRKILFMTKRRVFYVHHACTLQPQTQSLAAYLVAEAATVLNMCMPAIHHWSYTFGRHWEYYLCFRSCCYIHIILSFIHILYCLCCLIGRIWPAAHVVGRKNDYLSIFHSRWPSIHYNLVPKALQCVCVSLWMYFLQEGLKTWEQGHTWF
jgi:hypothetical protein